MIVIGIVVGSATHVVDKGVAVVGEAPAGMPSFTFSIPKVSKDNTLKLLGNALGTGGFFFFFGVTFIVIHFVGTWPRIS